VSAYSYFVQNFLFPTLAAFAAGLLSLGGSRKSSGRKRLVIALLIGILAFGLSWSVIPSGKTERPTVVAGAVVDDSSNDPIGQALVILTDESPRELARELSEDNGNFRLDLTGKLRGPRVRIHVAKDGYASADRTAEVPAEGLIIQLHHL
jgi:hypothetical protein